MFTMMIAGGIKWYREETLAQSGDGSTTAIKNTLFDFMFDHVYFPLSATIFALLAFYVASAAFRAFRAKNIHATLLLVAAVIVMIGRVPVGGAIWSGFPWLQEWLMTWPNTAGQRAIQIGAAIGMIATGLRVIFGIEKPYLKG
jgi:hypothetical protein